MRFCPGDSKVKLRPRASFGHVVSFCQNSWAVLGSAGIYPEVWCTPCGRNASGGHLKFFLSCWSQAFAAIEERSGDWLYSAEFLDAGGDVIHRICLAPESDLKAYESEGRLACTIAPSRGSSPKDREPPLLA